MIQEQPSLADGIHLERQKMLSDGTLKIEGAFYMLTKDCPDRKTNNSSKL
jgi:hypothetical protein